MIELAKHIEVLLLENECVIIPELGGFITYYQPAHFEEMDNTYYPPFRTIGFNPQLDMNDGQLVQSYMHTHHTDYPDALRMIKDKVRIIKEKLYQDGIVEIPNIGILHYTIHDSYEFQPNPCGFVAPSLYGLDSFHITPLTCATINEDDQYPDTFYQTRKNTHKHFDMRWIGNAVAVAIAIVLFFIWAPAVVKCPPPPSFSITTCTLYSSMERALMYTLELNSVSTNEAFKPAIFIRSFATCALNTVGLSIPCGSSDANA